MNISVILSHPNPASFNHAIARTVCETLRGAGHTPLFHDLHAEGFAPVMPTEELDRTDDLPPLVRQHTEELVAADGIILIHPNWWSAPPAMMAGWRDRCIRAGLAYRFEADANGNGHSVGMLKARFAWIINTLNTPLNVEEQILGNPMLKHWKEIVFSLCGVKEVSQKLIGPVITSTPEQRAQWLDEVKTLTLSKL